MKHFFKLIIVGVLPLTATAYGQNTGPWEQLFSSTFHNSSIYVENQCTFNVVRYFQQARQKGLDISQAEAIEIVNRGIGNIGFVTGFQCRSESPLDTKNNWYHHVIIKAGNMILDYDYLNQPTPVPLLAYFRTMFMNERMRKDPAYCLREIGKYEITRYSGKMFLKYYEDKARSSQITRNRAFLSELGWACLP